MSIITEEQSDSALNMQGEGLLKLTGQSQSFSTSRSTHACQL